MDIVYDNAGGRAKVVVREGYNAGKTFIRLYGSKKEYMIREGEYPTCRRSYLGEWSCLTSQRSDIENPLWPALAAECRISGAEN